MYPHRIRLRGPWDVTHTAGTHKVMMPATWAAVPSLPADGEVSMVREFGQPRTLDADERIWLDWSNLLPASLTLNDRHLCVWENDENGASFHEISDLILNRNRLVVTFPRTGTNAQSLGEFALEIRGPVYLEDVALLPNRLLTGRVTGQKRSGLELYVLAHGRTVLHQAVATGQPFAHVIPEASDGPAKPGFPAIRVELIEGSNVWWRADYPDGFTPPDSPDSLIPAE